MLHGAIFLFPVALATLSPGGDGIHSLARGWIVVFAVEVVLYLVGTAFIMLILAKDRTVHVYRDAAATDALTGLLNRRGFFEAAATLIARSRRSGPLLAFDLDHFKSINDRCGHAVGDAVLQLFAKVARETPRGSDIVGRLGGEEFVALLPVTLTEAGIAAERVRSAFAAASIVRNIACGAPSAAVDSVIMPADQALYRTKVNGHDRVKSADDETAYGPEARASKPGETTRPSRRRKEIGAVNYGAVESGFA